MRYEEILVENFFYEITSESKAREIIWGVKYGSKGFRCSCGCEEYYSFYHRPEVRRCKSCMRDIRLRCGTIFENSKLSLLLWLRAIYFIMQGKRGISALELKRVLGMKSYQTAWTILHKIRSALRERDDNYKLRDIIELDGASFGKREAGNKTTVLIAIETKDWIDEKGRAKSKAGFAKILVADETTMNAQIFVDKAIEANSMVNTDGGFSFRNLKNVDVDYQITDGDTNVLDHWLPWVHKFISNAKAFLAGTYHGVSAKYLKQYLAEYTYRFNRRHDLNSLFNRALRACCMAKPQPAWVLFG